MSVLDHWEKRLEKLKAELPRLCSTCSHHAPKDAQEEFYCRKFESNPPLDFATTENACADWQNILDEIPF